MGRLEVLAVTAGVFLILTAPAFAQYPAEPEQTTEASSTAAASSVQDEGQSSADQSVALTESDWWGEDDGLSFGYLPGGFGFGLGSCGSWSQPTGGGSVQWVERGWHQRLVSCRPAATLSVRLRLVQQQWLPESIGVRSAGEQDSPAQQESSPHVEPQVGC
jgi:hypothetical protein